MPATTMKTDRRPKTRSPGATRVFATATAALCHLPAALHQTSGGVPLQQPWHRHRLQAKLTISDPNDIYEQETDRVADQVMRMPEPAVLGSRAIAPNALLNIQRLCSACAEEQAEDTIHRKHHTAETPDLAPEAESHIGSSNGRGQPLPDSIRAFFEPRFGVDFSNVRVRTDSRAAESARAVNALAYTVGRDVLFGTSQYAPTSPNGRRLMAHELTHVVQQGPERRASGFPTTNLSGRQLGPIASSVGPIMQRDLARPPRRAPDPLVALTPVEIAAATAFNLARFADLYSIRGIRDVVGLEPVPAVVDEELIQIIVEWQAERHETQDGKVCHVTTRSLYLELVAESEFRDAILLLMDSYRLPGDLRLNDVRISLGASCCGTDGGAAAVTFGGPHCLPVGGPVNICFCRTAIPRDVAGCDHFVRIAGHKLIYIPQCAAGTGDVHVDEFEAFFFKACAGDVFHAWLRPNESITQTSP